MIHRLERMFCIPRKAKLCFPYEKDEKDLKPTELTMIFFGKNVHTLCTAQLCLIVRLQEVAIYTE